jgi:hypothetical protein
MKLTALVTLAILLAGAPAVAADTDLTIKRVKITSRGTVKILARFDPGAVDPDWEWYDHGITIEVNGTTVATARYGEGRFTFGKGLLFRYREDAEERCRLRLDAGDGTVRLKARKVVFPATFAPESLSIRLTMGEVEFIGTVAPTVGKKTTWYRGPKAPSIGRRVEFTRVDSHYNAYTNSGAVHVARSQAELESIWAGLWSGSARSHMPDVDFDSRMAVLVNVGPRRAMGFSVKVLEVRERGDGLHLVCRDSGPGNFCVTPDAMTGPWTLITLAPRPGIVTASFKIVRYDCRGPYRRHGAREW